MSTFDSWQMCGAAMTPSADSLEFYGSTNPHKEQFWMPSELGGYHTGFMPYELQPYPLYDPAHFQYQEPPSTYLKDSGPPLAQSSLHAKKTTDVLPIVEYPLPNKRDTNPRQMYSSEPPHGNCRSPKAGRAPYAKCDKQAKRPTLVKHEVFSSQYSMPGWRSFPGSYSDQFALPEMDRDCASLNDVSTPLSTASSFQTNLSISTREGQINNYFNYQPCFQQSPDDPTLGFATNTPATTIRTIALKDINALEEYPAHLADAEMQYQLGRHSSYPSPRSRSPTISSYQESPQHSYEHRGSLPDYDHQQQQQQQQQGENYRDWAYNNLFSMRIERSTSGLNMAHGPSTTTVQAEREVEEGQATEEAQRSCYDCGATKTPLWRKGPLHHCVCNRCGIRRARATQKRNGAQMAKRVSTGSIDLDHDIFPNESNPATNNSRADRAEKRRVAKTANLASPIIDHR